MSLVGETFSFWGELILWFKAFVEGSSTRLEDDCDTSYFPFLMDALYVRGLVGLMDSLTGEFFSAEPFRDRLDFPGIYLIDGNGWIFGLLSGEIYLWRESFFSTGAAVLLLSFIF